MPKKAQIHEHGSVARYNNGCRCQDCKKAKSAYRKALRTLPGGKLPSTDSRHGTYAGRYAGCSCVLCIAACAARRIEVQESLKILKPAKIRRSNRTSEEIEKARLRLRPNGLKECLKCHKILPLNAFSEKRTEADGLRYYCNSCETSRKKVNRYGKFEQYWAEKGIDFSTCALCDLPYEEVDHIYPVAKGGPNELWNYQPLCSMHNKSKNNKDPEVFYNLISQTSSVNIGKVESSLAYYLKEVKPKL